MDARASNFSVPASFMQPDSNQHGKCGRTNFTPASTIALDRAGIGGCAHRGAHLFRHSLATELLRSGATLSQIGQLLRHQSHDVTRIYAKGDLAALRPLSSPWPGGAQ